MRDMILMAFCLFGLSATLRYPFVGLLLWLVFSLMNPHQETYSIARTIPWNLVIAVVTTGSWLVSSERKTPPKGVTTGLVLALLAWTTINTFFAFDPSFSWTYWNRAWKTIAMCVVAGTLATNKVRFHAIIWVVVVSLCYYGVKGGAFTLMTGGGNHVYGPANSMIFDNNELALALVMTLPLMNYLRLQSGSRFIRIGIVAAIVLVVAAVLGSYSRGGYISLAAIAVAFWLRTKNKIVYPAMAVIVLIPLLKFMPDSFYLRLASIQNYGTDSSFQARLESWSVAYKYAMDHFPFGAGFYGMNLQGVWDKYIPGDVHAAHSIYFQVLGEQGVVGLALYLAVIAITFLNLSKVKRDTTGVAEYTWARDLAIMMQLSLLAFCVGGAAAPMDFYDVFLLWALLSAALHEHTRKKTVTLAAALSREFQPAAQPLGAPPT